MNLTTKTGNTYLAKILAKYSSNPLAINKIYFAGNLPEPPELAYQVNFPRVEMVIEGELMMDVGSDIGVASQYTLSKGCALYLPRESWNKQNWDKPVTTLSILVGKQSFGISLSSWNGTQFDAVLKENISRRGPRIGTFILQAIEELSWHSEDTQTTKLLFGSLFSHIQDLFNNPLDTLSKSRALFEAIRDYLEQNYQDLLTRESVAKHFYVSPNYLSQLFHKEGKIKFNEHINYIRLERAKYLLKKYDMKVKEVAHRCGFGDSNYFCRVFRNQTARSPSEYRVQYQSHIHQED